MDCEQYEARPALRGQEPANAAGLTLGCPAWYYPEHAAHRRAYEAVPHCSPKAPMHTDSQPSPAGEVGPLPPGTPERIGGYRIVGVLGEGGMGVVYAAEQENPHRRIAIKVIRAGQASVESVRRFAREGEVLGRLQHPGIAQVFEAGAEETPQGPQPFLAMELVHGRPLTEYVRDVQLGLRERLELFARVCDAVHYAHQRGVIHRDLKPANILVEVSGQPRILDFGVARLTDADIEATRQTTAGEIVGTLQYMSPEQIGADPLDIDIRSDVYSLGVILYELVADRLPYDLRAAAIYEAMRVILREDPAPLGSIDRNFRGDVETIVAKALEKEKVRRYGSAMELGSDVRHYLAHEPIAARPASASYQMQKFARRNRALVGGAVAAVIMLVLGATVSTWQAIRASAAERRAEQQRVAAVASRSAAESSRNEARSAQTLAEQRRSEAETQRSAADSARTNALREQRAAVLSAGVARREASKAVAVSDFLQEMLASADPSNTRGRDLTLREVLDTAAKRAGSSVTLKREPEVNAAVQATIGRTYAALGDFVRARPFLDTAYAQYLRTGGPSSLDLARTSHAQVGVLQGIGDDAAAERKAAEALGVLRQRLPADDDQVTLAMHGLAHARYRAGKPTEAEVLHREALALRRKRHVTPDTSVAISVTQLATFLNYVGKSKEALPLFTEAVTLLRAAYGVNHPSVIAALENQAATLDQLADFKGAERVAREMLIAARAVYGASHPMVSNALWRLGEALARQRTQQTIAEGEALLRQGLEMRRAVSGDQHPDVQLLRTALGRVLLDQQKFAAAETLFTDALNARRAAVGDKSPAIASSLIDLGQLADARRDYRESERRFREALPIWSAARLKVDEARAIVSIGRALQLQGKNDDAEPMLRDGMERLRIALGSESSEVGYVMEVIANMAMRRGNPAESERLHREALAIRRKVYGARSPLVRVELQNIAFTREAQGDTASAEPFLREALEILQAAFPGGSADVEFSRAWLGMDVCAQRRFAEAEPELRAAASALEKLKSNQLAFAQSAHGDCLRRMGRSAEAETALLGALRAIEGDAPVNAARRTTAIRRLVALYDAWGQPEKAAEWRGKLPPPS